MPKTIAKLEARIVRLESALRELVRLKDYKTKHGKTPRYTNEQVKAWDAARKALEQDFALADRATLNKEKQQ